MRHYIEWYERRPHINMKCDLCEDTIRTNNYESYYTIDEEEVLCKECFAETYQYEECRDCFDYRNDIRGDCCEDCWFEREAVPCDVCGEKYYPDELEDGLCLDCVDFVEQEEE